MLFQQFQKVVVSPTCQKHGEIIHIQHLCIHPDGDCDPRVCQTCDKQSKSQGLHVHDLNGQMRTVTTKTLNRLLVDHRGERLGKLMNEAETEFEKAIRKAQRGLEDLVMDYKRCILTMRRTIMKNEEMFNEIHSLQKNQWEELGCRDIRRLKESLQKQGYYQNINQITKQVENMREEIRNKLNQFSVTIKTAKQKIRLAIMEHSALAQARNADDRLRITNLNMEIRKNTKSHGNYFNRAYHLANIQSHTAVAELNYRYCLDINPFEGAALNNLGSLCKIDSKLQRYGVAAMTSSFMSKIILVNYANQLVKASQFGKAQQFLRKALQIQATHDIHQSLAAIYSDTGRFQQAVQQLTLAIVLSPKCRKLYTFRAQAYQKLGKAQQAEADRQQVKEVQKTT